MSSIPRIVNIFERSREGVTRPFICNAEDGLTYYVKGSTLGGALRNEWIAGLIAKELELPIPDFKILFVPSELIKYSVRDDINDLGIGYVFGSKSAGNDVVCYSHSFQITDDSLKKKLILFDWLTRNSDRLLSEWKGNVNLLWDVNLARLIVIDHNLAFDDRFDSVEFWKNHVFADNPQNIFTEEFILEYEPILKSCIEKFSGWCGDIPENWSPLDDIDEYKRKVFYILNRFNTAPDEFWRGHL